MFGKLFIVATPIGNLSDITFRALETLREAAVIACEDTRMTKRILDRYEIEGKKLLSYHHHSSSSRKQEILKLIIDGSSVALVTDAGTPGISDPGNELVNYLLHREPRIEIVPVPGPSSLTAAVSVSGFDMQRFTFLGFMPKKKRLKLFDSLKNGDIPFVFYESPFRIVKTLNDMVEYFGDVEILVARELTKMHETIYRGTVTSVLDQMGKGKIKGEIVVLVPLPGIEPGTSP